MRQRTRLIHPYDITVKGQLFLQNGSESAPSLAFVNDTDTGIFYASTYIGFAVGGSEIAQVNADGLTFGTSPTIDATTSQIRAIGGTAVETLTAGGVAYARTGGNIDISAIATTSGVVTGEFRGFSSSTNPAATAAGTILRLANLDTTDGNYSLIEGFESGGPSPVAGIAFVNDSHANNEGSIAIMTRPSGGILTRTWNFTSAGNLQSVTGYLIPLITDTDGTQEGSIWYDQSEDKLKFKTAAGVETITSS